MEAVAIIMGLAMVLSAVFSGIGIQKTQEENEKNRKQAEELNKSQQEFAASEAEKANQREIENYTNLQSPEAMMQQIKNAGLSTSYMYGSNGVSSGKLSSGAQAASPNLHSSFTDAVGIGNQYAALGTNTNEAANTALQFNEAIKSASGNKLVEAQTLTEQFKAQSEEALAKIKTAEATNIEETLQATLNEINNRSALLDEQIKGFKLKNTQDEALLESRINTEIELNKTAVKEALQKLDLNEKQMEYIDKQMHKIDQDVKLEWQNLAEKKRQFDAELQQRDDLNRREIKARKEMKAKELKQDLQKFWAKLNSDNKHWKEEFGLEKAERINKMINMYINSTAGIIDAVIPF